MSGNRDHLEIAFASIQCFADDGTLDHAELEKLIAIAERDGVYTADETRVLGSIIKRIDPTELDAPMREKLAALQKRLTDNKA